MNALLLAAATGAVLSSCPATMSASTPLVQTVSDREIRDAYKAQRRLVAAKISATGNNGIAGYKGGGANIAMLKSLGIAQPVFGVLLRQGEVTAPVRLKRSDFGQLWIETEVGFVTNRRIGSKLRNARETRAIVASIVPALELPDVAKAAAPSLPTGISRPAEMIRRNVAASHFARGHPASIPRDIDAVAVTLRKDGREVSTGRGGDAMGSQWLALQCLVNEIVEHRGAVAKGALIITGSLGIPQPGEIGTYRADFGELGAIEFVIEK